MHCCNLGCCLCIWTLCLPPLFEACIITAWFMLACPPGHKKSSELFKIWWKPSPGCLVEGFCYKSDWCVCECSRLPLPWHCRGKYLKHVVFSPKILPAFYPEGHCFPRMTQLPEGSRRTTELGVKCRSCTSAKSETVTRRWKNVWACLNLICDCKYLPVSQGISAVQLNGHLDLISMCVG